jgi:hypothetical protein
MARFPFWAVVTWRALTFTQLLFVVANVITCVLLRSTPHHTHMGATAHLSLFLAKRECLLKRPERDCTNDFSFR